MHDHLSDGIENETPPSITAVTDSFLHSDSCFFVDDWRSIGKTQQRSVVRTVLLRSSLRSVPMIDPWREKNMDSSVTVVLIVIDGMVRNLMTAGTDESSSSSTGKPVFGSELRIQAGDPPTACAQFGESVLLQLKVDTRSPLLLDSIQLSDTVEDDNYDSSDIIPLVHLSEPMTTTTTQAISFVWLQRCYDASTSLLIASIKIVQLMPIRRP
jgi:hypothetical protein